MSCSTDAHFVGFFFFFFSTGTQQVELKQTSLSNLRHIALLSANALSCFAGSQSVCQPGSCVSLGFSFHSPRLTAAMQTENHKTLIFSWQLYLDHCKRENVFGLCLPITHPPLHALTSQKRSRQMLCSGLELIELWEGPFPSAKQGQWIWGSFGMVCDPEPVSSVAKLLL